MNANRPPIEARFIGCMLGLAVGDALGAPFEGQPPESLGRHYQSPGDLFEFPAAGELEYTDDTQMAIGVAETLIACGAIDETEICRRFAANYTPHRGYGRGARVVLDAMRAGHDHRDIAAGFFPGGSFGNGAAMRVAPIGLAFRHDHDRVWEQARLSALPTHTHPLAIEGAQLLALAVAMASETNELRRDDFLETLASRCGSAEFRDPLCRAAKLFDRRELAEFGNGVEAASSVVTSIASFTLTPHSYEETVGNVVLLGGDTDTLAAMAGAISGAYLGHAAIPAELIHRLEDGHQGRSYLEELARALITVHDDAAL